MTSPDPQDPRTQPDTPEPRWAELAKTNGWRKSSAAHCPMVVAGRLCHRTSLYGRPCICEQWAAKYGSSVVDHSRMSLAGGSRVLTYEPYGDPRRSDRFEEFRLDCARLGLTVTVGPESPYRPGATTLLIISRAPESTAETP